MRISHHGIGRDVSSSPVLQLVRPCRPGPPEAAVAVRVVVPHLAGHPGRPPSPVAGDAAPGHAAVAHSPRGRAAAKVSVGVAGVVHRQSAVAPLQGAPDEGPAVAAGAVGAAGAGPRQGAVLEYGRHGLRGGAGVVGAAVAATRGVGAAGGNRRGHAGRGRPSPAAVHRRSAE